MNPLSINPLVLLGAGAAALAIGFSSGWATNGWRKDVQVAELKTEAASKQAKAATDALTGLEADIKRIASSARTAQGNVGAVNIQLDQIRKDFKNENAPPLPANCRPDDIRVRSLTAAAGAVDQAIAGSKLGGAVQRERSTAVTK